MLVQQRLCDADEVFGFPENMVQHGVVHRVALHSFTIRARLVQEADEPQALLQSEMDITQYLLVELRLQILSASDRSFDIPDESCFRA